MIAWLFPRRSIVCSVHERADHDANVVTRAEELVFLREGFSWLVAIFPPIGLLMRGAWLALLLYLVSASALVAGVGALGANPAIGVLAVIGLGIIFGFEVPAFERWRMARSGWDEIGVVSGADIDECERRFFDAWMSSPTLAPAPLPAIAAVPPRTGLLRRLFAARP